MVCFLIIHPLSEDGDSFCGGEVAADMSTVGSYMDVVPSSTGSGSGAATPERAFPRLHLLPMTAAEELGLPLGADAASSGDAGGQRVPVTAAVMEVDEVGILAGGGDPTARIPLELPPGLSEADFYSTTLLEPIWFSIYCLLSRLAPEQLSVWSVLVKRHWVSPQCLYHFLMAVSDNLCSYGAMPVIPSSFMEGRSSWAFCRYYSGAWKNN